MNYILFQIVALRSIFIWIRGFRLLKI